jgi:hypothetical protein
MKKRPGKSNRKKFDQKKEVRAIARERVGSVKASRVVVPKTQREKPKYKKPAGETDE